MVRLEILRLVSWVKNKSGSRASLPVPATVWWIAVPFPLIVSPVVLAMCSVVVTLKHPSCGKVTVMLDGTLAKKLFSAVVLSPEHVGVRPNNGSVTVWCLGLAAGCLVAEAPHAARVSTQIATAARTRNRLMLRGVPVKMSILADPCVVTRDRPRCAMP